MKRNIWAAGIALALGTTLLAGCGNNAPAKTTQITQAAETQAAVETTAVEKDKTPKYIFMFIGDGMSYPQIELTNYFESANKKSADKVTVDGKEKTILKSDNYLNMMNLEVSGSVQTYDSTSFAPDSASTATSIATGRKTWSGSINVSEDFSTEYKTIAEKLKEQKGYKIGIISSVNLNHATPAAFYAHQISRNNYYEIGVEMVESGFDFFAGGGLKKTKGNDGDKENVYDLAEKAGYKVVYTQKDAAALTAADGKCIVIGETLADSDSLSYDIDRAEGEWSLADYVDKGIECLADGNDNGFFMMVEGGKIDWACHANDAAATITDTIAFDDAVAKAIEFYEKHPDETLIIVTGDHETGGLTIGYAGTDYDTFLTNINNQKISFQAIDDKYVKGYKENKTDFDTVMKDITELFGLQVPNSGEEAANQKDSADLHPESEESGSLVMTEYEYSKLKAAYDVTMNRTGEEKEYGQEEYVLYGSYEPLSVTITHILNNKSGISFSSYAHTGLAVEVLAEGAGAEVFDGYYDNTDIYNKLAALTGIK